MKKTGMIFAAVLFAAVGMQAQVHIGDTDADPVPGALLDLSTTGNLGLLPLNVSIESVDKIPLAFTEQGGEGPVEDLKGLIVYNTNALLSGGNGVGLYVWDGTVWHIVRDCPTTVQDDEGNSYFVGQFGAAGCWMTQNLRSTYTMQGSTKRTITSGTNANYTTDVARYYYPNKNTDILSTHPEYGLLYTWKAANIGTSATESSDAFPNKVSTRQGICPTGWHLPSDYEWSRLEEVIAKDDTYAYSTTGATVWETSYTTENDTWRGQHGSKMLSTIDNVPTDDIESTGTSRSSNANGFDAITVGSLQSGYVDQWGTIAGWWAASSRSGDYTWVREVGNAHLGVRRLYALKGRLRSVRCVKNDI